MPSIQIPSNYVTSLFKEQQINELNNEVRCKIGVSKVNGVGVIALRNISEGEKCYCTPRVIPKFYTIPYCSLNQLFPEIRELILARWASVVNGSIFQSPNDDAGLIFFMNHSENPNYEIMEDVALSDIKKGEELFSNYKLMANYEKVWPDINQWTSAKGNQELSILKRVKRKLSILLLLLKSI